MRKQILAALVLAVSAVVMLASCATAKDVGITGDAQKDVEITVDAQPVAGASVIDEIDAEDETVCSGTETAEVPVEGPKTFTYEWLGARITADVYPGMAVLRYPAGSVSLDRVVEFMAFAVDSYGYMLEGVTYSAEDGEITFLYPEQWGEAEFKLAEKILMDSIPAFFAEDLAEKTTEEPVPAVEVAEIEQEPAVEMSAEEKAEAGIEIAEISYYDPYEYTMEDTIAMYQPEEEAPQEIAAEPVQQAGDDLDGFVSLESAEVDLSAFTWITGSDETGDQAEDVLMPYAAEVPAENVAPVAELPEPETPAESVQAGETGKTDRTETVTWVIWGLVALGLLVLGLSNLKRRKN